MLIKALMNLRSPAGVGGRLSIPIFHRVLPEIDPIFPNEMHARRFDETCRWLKSWFNVLPLDIAIEQLRAGTLPARAAAITFDDGYADNHDVAAPILLAHGLKATFFISTGFLDGGRMWNDTIIEAVRACRSLSIDLVDAGLGSHRLESHADRCAAIDSLIGKVKYLDPAKRREAVACVQDYVGVPLPDDLMMTSDQVLRLHRMGMQIGGHTSTHPILSSLPDNDAFHEIVNGKKSLETLLQQRIGLFAYPNGKPTVDYLDKHVEMVKRAGFDAAVSTSPGVSHAGTDVFQLPRFSPWGRRRLQYGIRMFANLRSAQPLCV